MGPLKCLGLEQTFRWQGKPFPVCTHWVPGGEPLGPLPPLSSAETPEPLFLKVGLAASPDLFCIRHQRSIVILVVLSPPSTWKCFNLPTVRYISLLGEILQLVNGWCHAT